MGGVGSMGGPGGSASLGSQTQVLMQMMQMMMQLFTLFMGGRGLPSAANFDPAGSAGPGLDGFLGGGGYGPAVGGGGYGGGYGPPVDGGGYGGGVAPSGGEGGYGAPISAGPGAVTPMAPTAPVQPVSVDGRNYAFPVAGYDPNKKIELHHGSHPGAADLFAPEGTPVVAMMGGTVTQVGSGGLGGYSATIKGDDGLTYYYAHFSEAAQVSQGQRVETGQPIGKVGRSGNAASTPPHLHLGVGTHIISGGGPSGGAGANFDLNGLLNQIQASHR